MPFKFDLFGDVVRAPIDSEDFITPKRVNAALKEAAGDDLEIQLYTAGGSASAGVFIRNILIKYRTDNDAQIHFIGIGDIASAGTVLTTAGTKVSLFDTVQFMIHEPREAAIFTADEADQFAADLRQLEDIVVNLYADFTKGNPETIRTMMKKTTFFNAQDAVDFGFAHEVINGTRVPVDPAMFDYPNCPDELKNVMDRMATLNEATERAARQLMRMRAKVAGMTMRDLVSDIQDLNN